MASPSSLNDIRKKLQKTETAFERINNQSSPQLIDIDTFLGHIRELYEMGIDLKATNSPKESPNGSESDLPNKTSQKAEADPQANRAFSEENTEGKVEESDFNQNDPREVQAEDSSTANSDLAEKSDHNKENTSETTPSHTDESSAELKSFAEEEPKDDESEEEDSADTLRGSPESKENTSQPVTTSQETVNKNSGNAKPLYKKFTGKQTALHEKLQEKNQGQSLADKFRDAPISDLKSAIGVNERKLFINDLFDGNKHAFHDTVSHVNEASSYDQAITYLDQTIKKQYNWDEDSKTVAHFLELVYRRFMSKA